jgi:hypothetical protein
MKRPLATRIAEQALNPLIGKSFVAYATKPHLPRAGAGAGTGPTDEAAGAAGAADAAADTRTDADTDAAAGPAR